MDKSRWHTGTYEMYIWAPTPGELSIHILAKAISLDNPADDQDAPFLAGMDLTLAELGITAPAFPLGLRDVGEQGLAPEDVEAVFGPQMGVRVLLTMWQAAERDFRGVDMDARPWREPSDEAFPIMERTFDIMVLLKERLYGK